MKKSLIAMAVLAAAAGSASAQSSVTVFGILDVAVRHVDGDGTTKTLLSSGGLSTGRIGFRGIEDLGGGLKAGFWLESQINADDGTQPQSRFWHRRSTVSLISDSMGEVRLGRDFSPTYSAFADYDAFGDNGVGAFTAMYKPRTVSGVAPQTAVRADNQVSYILPTTLGGVYGQASVAAGEGTGGAKYYGGRLGYKNGPFDISAAYGQTQLLTTDDKYKLFVVGGSYDFGVAKILAAYQEAKYDVRVASIDGLKDKLLTVGATVPVGAFVIRASYDKVKADDDKNADRFTVGGIYNLSKRTAFYGTYSVIDNDDKGTFVVADSPAVAAGKKSQGLEFGVRHSF